MRGRFEMGMFHDRTTLPKERELEPLGSVASPPDKIGEGWWWGNRS